MPQHRHKAIAAGLALTLTFGALAVPALASTSDAHVADGVASDGSLPAPTGFDRMDEFSPEPAAEQPAAEQTAMLSRAVAALSDEMKYFSKFESSCNYDQGFSYGDGYNAMGYYQFDRRYALVPFIESTYRYNPTKYSMFAEVVKRGNELKTGKIYDSSAKRLTELGQLAENAWHAAYATDPVEFAALQDAYSYNEYYIPVERSLKRDHKVDISGRADCVKGLAWGMCNLFGQGGVQKFFRAANLKDSMTDREMVTALCDAVVSYYSTGAGRTNPYANGYVNRYRNEKKICLSYVEKHEAEQAKPEPEAKPEVKPEVKPEPETKPEANPETPQQPETKPETPQQPEEGPGSEAVPETPQTPAEPEPEAPSLPEQTPDAGDTGSQEGSGADDAGSQERPGTDGSENDAPEDDAPATDEGSKPGEGAQGDSQDESSKTHSIIFDDCDPTTPNAMFTVLEGSAFSAQNKLPADPEHPDHIFDGWYAYDPDTKQYGDAFDVDAPVTRDLYIAAKWTPRVFGGIEDPKVDLELSAEEKAAAEEEAKAKRLAQTSDAAGMALMAAAALSATGTAAIAIGGKVHLRRNAESRERDL